MWGGRLQSKVDIDTDFVVMGTEPQVQSFTADELTAPITFALKADQEAELKRYNDIITTARELHIPIMIRTASCISVDTTTKRALISITAMSEFDVEGNPFKSG